MTTRWVWFAVGCLAVSVGGCASEGPAGPVGPPGPKGDPGPAWEVGPGLALDGDVLRASFAGTAGTVVEGNDLWGDY